MLTLQFLTIALNWSREEPRFAILNSELVVDIFVPGVFMEITQPALVLFFDAFTILNGVPVDELLPLVRSVEYENEGEQED